MATIQNQPGITTFVGKINTPILEKEKKESASAKSSKKAHTDSSKKVKKHIKPGVKAQTTNTTGPRKRAQPDNNNPDNNNIQLSKRKSTTMSNQSPRAEEANICGIQRTNRITQKGHPRFEI